MANKIATGVYFVPIKWSYIKKKCKQFSALNLRKLPREKEYALTLLADRQTHTTCTLIGDRHSVETFISYLQTVCKHNFFTHNNVIHRKILVRN